MALAANAHPRLSQPSPATRLQDADAFRKKRQSLKMASATWRAVAIGLSFCLVLAYVALTARLTAQTYRLSDAQVRQDRLVRLNNAMMQQVAQLRSLPRLEAAAVKLHMTEQAHVTAIVSPKSAPRQDNPPPVAAELVTISRWLRSW